MMQLSQPDSACAQPGIHEENYSFFRFDQGVPVSRRSRFRDSETDSRTFTLRTESLFTPAQRGPTPSKAMRRCTNPNELEQNYFFHFGRDLLPEILPQFMRQAKTTNPAIAEVAGPVFAAGTVAVL